MEKNVFQEAHDHCPDRIRPTDLQFLGIDPLEKSSNCQNRPISRIQYVKADHERYTQLTQKSRQGCGDQAEHFNKRRQQFIYQIVKVGNRAHKAKPSP